MRLPRSAAERTGVRTAGAAAAGIGVAALVGWAVDLPWLTTWQPDTVPMAPVTAALSVLLGVTLVLCATSGDARGEAARRAARPLALGAALTALALLVLRSTGIFPDAEFLGFSIGGTIGGAAVGFASPVTAFCFLVAGLSLLALALPAESDGWPQTAAGWLGGVGLTSAGFGLALANLLGTPILIGGGNAIPVALSTSVVILLCGLGITLLAGAYNAGPRKAAPARRRFVFVFVALMLAVLGAGYTYYLNLERGLRIEQERLLASVAELKALSISQWRRERTVDARLLHRNAPIASLVRRLVARPDDPAARRDLTAWFQDLGPHLQSDGIFIFDAGSRLVASLPAGRPAAAAIRAEVPAVLASGAVRLQDFFEDEDLDAPRLATLVPVESDDAGGPRVGVLAVRIDPRENLLSILARRTTVSQSSEAVLVRRDGETALFLTEFRSTSGTAMRRRVPLANTEVLAAQAVLGRTGVVEGTNYRGVRVIAVVRAIPETPWFLISSVERWEFDERLWQQLGVVSALGALLLASVGSGLAFIWRSQGTRFYRQQAALTSELQATTAQLRGLLDSSPTIIYELRDTGGGLTTSAVSGNVERLLGFTAAEALHPDWWATHIHPEDRDAAFAVMATIRDHDDLHHEYRFLRRDGSELWVRDELHVVRRAGERPLEVTGSWNDITARRREEARTRRVTQLYAALTQCNEAIVRCTTEEQLFPRICEAAVTYGGMALAWIGMVDEGTGMVRPVASFGSGTEYLDGIQISVDAGSPFGRGPTGICIRENRPFWVTDFAHEPSTELWHARARRFGWGASVGLPLTREGRPVGALTIYALTPDAFDEDGRNLLTEMATDISFALGVFARNTRRVRAESRLRESEARYRTMFTDSGLPMLLMEPDTGRIVDANHAASRFYGWDLSALQAMRISDINLIGDEVETHLDRARTGRQVRFEVRHRLASGEIRDVDVFSSTLVAGGATRILTTVIDVTARTQAEDALRDKEHLLSEAQRMALLGSWTLTASGEASWSAEMYRLFDVPPGTSPTPGAFMALVHPDDRARVADTLEALWRGDSPGPVEYRTIRADGEIRYMTGGGERRLDARHEPYLTGTVQDITDRTLAEHALRRSLHEKEALLKEVHHRVKNNLQVISSLLRLEAGRAGDGGVKAVLAEMQNRVLSMALLHEALYRSGNLAQVDLSVYLRQLVHQIFRSLAPAAAVTLHLDLQPVHVELDQAVPCGLIVNELVSNSLKHGWPSGGEGSIRVALHATDDGAEVRLAVSDTGVGLPGDFDERRARSLGLQLVDDLARQLQGALAVDPGPGAAFSVTFVPKTPESPRVPVEMA